MEKLDNAISETFPNEPTKIIVSNPTRQGNSRNKSPGKHEQSERKEQTQ